MIVFTTFRQLVCGCELHNMYLPVFFLTICARRIDMLNKFDFFFASFRWIIMEIMGSTRLLSLTIFREFEEIDHHFIIVLGPPTENMDRLNS